MSLALKSSESNVIVGLGTFTYTIINTGIQNVYVESFVTPTSGLSIVINHNGSPVATSATPSAAQTHIDLRAQFQCAANDTLSVVLSSSSATESLPNTVKTIVVLDQNV